MSRREVSGYSVSSYVGTHKNYGKFWGNYYSRVLVLLDFGTRVIVPQRSAQSLSVICHGHSPSYISQSLNKHVTLA